jgi:hypothetical protein
MFDLNTLDPKKVAPTPFVGPGVKYRDVDVINLDDIWVEPRENNHARHDTLDEYQIQKLVVQLGNGINYNLSPPIVKELVNPIVVKGKTYHYILICGHHRFEAMMRLGFDRWIFWIYDLCLNGYSIDDSKTTLQILENDHNTPLPNKAEDVSGAVSHLIQHNSKLVINTEDSIKNYIDTYCKNMHHNTRAKAVAQVMSKLGTYQRVVTYTSDNADEWIKKYTDYTNNGEFDAKRNENGWSLYEGYEYELLFNAMNKLVETTRSSYFVCRTKAPTEERNLDTRRKDMLKRVEKLENSLLRTFQYYQEHGKFPWRVESWYPQNTETEPKDKPVFLV